MTMTCAVTHDLDAYQGRVDAQAMLDAAAERLSTLWMDVISTHCPGIPSSFNERLAELLSEAAYEAVTHPVEDDPADAEDAAYRLYRRRMGYHA